MEDDGRRSRPSDARGAAIAGVVDKGRRATMPQFSPPNDAAVRAGLVVKPSRASPTPNGQTASAKGVRRRDGGQKITAPPPAERRRLVPAHASPCRWLWRRRSWRR
jgi:hypothetical protein